MKIKYSSIYTAILVTFSCISYSQDVVPISVKISSYLNFKDPTIGPLNIEEPSKSIIQNPAYAIADFTQSGRVDMIVFDQVYRTFNKYPDIEKSFTENNDRFLSNIEYWHGWGNGKFTQVRSFHKKGCLHPRKALVADFNGDGYPDIFVACTGYDEKPFPGEKNMLMINDKRGSFIISYVGNNTGYTHGATAYDFRGDGYADVAVADPLHNPNVYFLRNQHDGTFKEDYSSVPRMGIGKWEYNSIELVDINNDGVPELVVGGNESWSNPTVVLFSNKEGKYTNANKIELPRLPNRSVVLDFTYVSNNNQPGLYINRTTMTPFYAAYTLQYVDLKTLSSKILIDYEDPISPHWIYWWLPVIEDGKTGVTPSTGFDAIGLSIRKKFIN